MLTDALAAELTRIRRDQNTLAVRAAHVESALRLARQGEAEGVVRAILESRHIIVLVRPGVTAGSGT
jgi:hypothetical protein